MRIRATGRTGRLICTWCIVIVAVCIRCVSLGDRSWWIDELVTRNVARLPLWAPGALHADHPATHSIVAFCLRDTGPGPLTYMLDGCLARWAEPLGREFWLRVPGVLAGVFTVLFVLRRGRSWVGGWPGTICMAAFAATFPLWIESCTGARGYGWAILAGIVQTDCLLRLTGPAGLKAKGLTSWVVLCVVSAAGFLVHPFHIVWNASVILAAMVARFRRQPCPIASVPSSAIWGGILLLGLVHVAWTIAFVSGIGPMASTPAGVSRMDYAARGIARFAGGLRDNPSQAYSAGWILLSPLLLGCLWRRKRRSAGMHAAALAMIFTTLLCAVLLLRFFLVPRYLYPLTIGLTWLIGMSIQKIHGLAARRGRRTYADALAVACGAALLVVPFRGALRTSVLPVHDWATAVTWLKEHYRQGDLVLCGPNSDAEVFQAYSQAAGIGVPAIVKFDDQWHRSHDTGTVEGIRVVLSTDRRLWFVTPHWGAVRPMDYWVLVDSAFREAVRIPAQGEIRILFRDPAAGR